MNEILYLKMNSILDAFPHEIFVNFELGFLTHFREIFLCNNPTELRKTKGFPREVCDFIEKETLPQVFSSEFCEFFSNTFLYRTPLFADDCFSFLELNMESFRKMTVIKSFIMKF